MQKFQNINYKLTLILNYKANLNFQILIKIK